MRRVVVLEAAAVPRRTGGRRHPDSTWKIEAAEDGGGGAALFDEVFGVPGDFFEEVDGLGAGFETAEVEGVVGELAEIGDGRLHCGRADEGEEVGGAEFLPLGEGDHVEAVDHEGAEEAVLFN